MTKQQQNDSANKIQGGSRNLASGPESASHAARKGDQQSQASEDPALDEQDPGSPSGQRRGGSETIADDPERAGEAGRNGGHRSHVER